MNSCDLRCPLCRQKYVTFEDLLKLGMKKAEPMLSNSQTNNVHGADTGFVAGNGIVGGVDDID